MTYLTLSNIECCFLHSYRGFDTPRLCGEVVDFGYTAYIADVIVKPEFQGKGIGRLMIEYLLSKIKENSAGDDFLMINLLAAPGKSGFYEKVRL